MTMLRRLDRLLEPTKDEAPTTPAFLEAQQIQHHTPALAKASR
jgi:hypothetical protein